MQPGGGVDLTAIGGRSPDAVWLGGSGGLLARWDGAAAAAALRDSIDIATRMAEQPQQQPPAAASKLN